jgi:hypothetical protein
MTAPDQSPARYRIRIRIRGHLDPAWSTWFDSLTVTLEDDGTTELVGPLVDQGALFGLLARLRDLGATLLLADRLQTGEPAARRGAANEREETRWACAVRLDAGSCQVQRHDQLGAARGRGWTATTTSSTSSTSPASR